MGFTKSDRRQDAKTDLWDVWSLRGAIHLGWVKWFPHGRKYAFHPAELTVFDEDCLREIATFCELETQRHKAGRRAFRD